MNGDDVDAVCYVFKLAVMYRQKFGADVVVDICAYRKYGHNEIDQPAFTQPHMYNQIIPGQVKSLIKYKEKLISEGIVLKKNERKKKKQRGSIFGRLLLVLLLVFFVSHF